MSCDFSTLISRPEANASKTFLYLSIEKIKVILTLIPCAISSVTAGNPWIVPGTFISKFFRSTMSQSSFPCLIVAAASRAKRGSTSRETLPSISLDSLKVFENRSQASLTSSVVIFVMISSILLSLFCKISLR